MEVYLRNFFIHLIIWFLTSFLEYDENSVRILHNCDMQNCLHTAIFLSQL